MSFKGTFILKLAGSLCWLAMMACGSLVADVTITRLANQGVIIEDGETRIMIDGFVVEPYSLYGGLPPDLAQQFATATGLFAGIDLALASHKHHDHNQPEFACNFLKVSEQTRLVTSTQVIDLVRERCRPLVRTSSRVGAIDPRYAHPVVLPVGTAEITVFLLSHGTGKYASLQNFGHLVDIGGVRILHVGDAAMDPTDFETAQLASMDIDVALIPFWFFQPGPGIGIVEEFMDAPSKFAVQIPPDEIAEASVYLAENYPDVQMMTLPGESVVIRTGEPVTE